MSSRESYTSVINRKAAAKQQLMNVAMGRERADLVLKNAVYVNVFTNELSQGDIAVKNGVNAGICCFNYCNESGLLSGEGGNS